MRSRLRFVLALAVFCGAALNAQGTPAKSLPDRLSDAEYWKLVMDISEPDDYFRIVDNFTSNEPEVGELFSLLRSTHVSGGVYLGVGPEQNLTYIAAIRPKMAFICDIRRQAVMHHLMYKAMFELSKDRADFISILFGKARPAGIDSTTGIDKIWNAFGSVPTDSALGARNYTRVLDNLRNTHKFVFSMEELGKFKKVYDAFQYYGPGITTQSGSGGGRGGGPGGGRTFVDLTGYDYDNKSEAHSFLSSEENFQFVKSLHEKNLVVAVSGDFGKTKALKAIGAWISDHGVIVKAYYVSNVEQYLFQDGKNAQFYANVATFPLDSTSVFIRPYSMRRGGVGGGVTKSLCPIVPFLAAVARGGVATNNDALACPN